MVLSPVDDYLKVGLHRNRDKERASLYSLPNSLHSSSLFTLLPPQLRQRPAKSLTYVTDPTVPHPHSVMALPLLPLSATARRQCRRLTRIMASRTSLWPSPVAAFHNTARQNGSKKDSRSQVDVKPTTAGSHARTKCVALSALEPAITLYI